MLHPLTMSSDNNTTITDSSKSADIVPKDATTAWIDPAVTTIKDRAFGNCTSLQSITLPTLVTNIGNAAFFKCRSLTTIHIPDSVTSIKYKTFEGCSSLQSIHIPDQVTSIGESAFEGCASLTSINIPRLVSTIGNDAFNGCTSLSTIDIPELVTTIQYGTFSKCTSLQTVHLPTQLTTIANAAFFECTSLQSIILPDQITTIQDYAFFECTSLYTIQIPDTVTKIGYYAFYGCTSLVLAVIPHSVKMSMNDAHDSFVDCHTLEQRLKANNDDNNNSSSNNSNSNSSNNNNNNNNFHTHTDTWLRQRFDNLPLHQACYNKHKPNTNQILQNLIQKHGTSILTSTDAMLMTPLHILCSNPTSTLDTIQILKNAQPDVVTMKNVMGKTPLMILLETKNVESYNTFHDKNKNEDGKLLPLVGLLKKGLDLNALEIINVLSNDEMILDLVSQCQHQDEISGLIPVLYGASLRTCTLDVVYELAIQLPDLLTREHV
jgi:hypothetical protein